MFNDAIPEGTRRRDRRGHRMNDVRKVCNGK